MKISVILLFTFKLNHCSTDCDSNSKHSTFLWSVRSTDKITRGFLFGTIHVPYTEVWDHVSDRVREAFSYSDTVLLEIDLRNDETVKRLVRCKNLKRKQTSTSYLQPKLHQQIKEFLEKFRRYLVSCSHKQTQVATDSYILVEDVFESIIGNWDRKRPEWLLFALYQLCEDFVNRPTSPMLDVFLANKAYQEEKQIRAIETAHEQCNPVASLSQEEIVFAINYTINYLEYLYRTKRLFEINSHRSLATLVRDYRCGNIDERHFEINDLSTAGFEMEPKEKQRAEKIHRHLREDIISKRNERMAHRLNKLFSSNPGIVIFTAIGTGHFFGNDSVLHHLHKMGYVVQSVKEDDVIIPPRNRDRTYTFNSLWLRDNSSMSGLSVEVVHVHSSAPSVPYMAIGTALSLMLYSMLNSMSHFS